MQVLLLGMFVALFLHDALTGVEIISDSQVARVVEAMHGDAWPSFNMWATVLMVVLPKLFVVLFYGLICRRTRKRLGTQAGQRALNLLEATTSALPYLLLLLFILDLFIGALRWLRVVLSHVVLVDEVSMMLPTLSVAIVAWVCYYPVDRRLSEALIFRHADQGKVIYPILSRSSYVVMQLRNQFGIMLLPLLAVFGWSESLVLLGPDHEGPLSRHAVMTLTPLGVFAVFLLSPLLIRHVWQTAPLPAGEVRQAMQALCQQHNVRVRELLLWRTGGRLVNAAVTGLVSQLRYILLSDSLLDQLSPREVEAVMAHELAHVKLRHLIWMAIIVIVSLGFIENAGYAAINAWTDNMADPATIGHLGDSHDFIDLTDADTQMILVSLPTFGVTLLLFGWVSRRVERQADVFAVRHLSLAMPDTQTQTTTPVFSASAIFTMIHALQRVAELNHAPTTRKSWRHGSVAWRQEHLQSLLGQPLNNAHIDRLMARVKAAAVLGLCLLIVLYAIN